MSMTRREALVTSGALLLGTAACSRTPADGGTGAAQDKPAPVHERSELASTAGRRVSVRFEGMIATVLISLKSKPGTPVAADFALMDVLAENDPEIKDRHYPTLTIPRVLVKGTPTIPPDAVDGHYAYWALAERNLEIVSTAKSALKFNAKPDPTTQEPGPLPQTWANLAWLSDMN